MLNTHEESIQQLHQFAEGRLTAKSKSNPFGTEEYERTLLDEQFT